MRTGEPRHSGILTVGTRGRPESDGSARRESDILASSETASFSRLPLRSYAMPTRIIVASRTISAAATKSPATFGVDPGGTAGDIAGPEEVCAQAVPVPYAIDAKPNPGINLWARFMANYLLNARCCIHRAVPSWTTFASTYTKKIFLAGASNQTRRVPPPALFDHRFLLDGGAGTGIRRAGTGTGPRNRCPRDRHMPG